MRYELSCRQYSHLFTNFVGNYFIDLIIFNSILSHNVLSFIFPKCPMDFRVVCYTCTWGRGRFQNSITATAYQGDREAAKSTATIFLEANFHYTNIADNVDLAHIPIARATTTEEADHPQGPVPFHLLRGTMECTVRPGYEQMELRRSPTQVTPDMAAAIHQEHDYIKTLAPLAIYSLTLAEALAPHIKGARDLTQYRATSLMRGKGLRHIDVGFNLFAHDWSTSCHVIRGAATGSQHTDIQRLLQLEMATNLIQTQEPVIQCILRSFLTDNRCLILHISAALDINPLHLEVNLVREAISLLALPGIHATRTKILTSILDYDGSPNANIFTLVFPELIRHATIRVLIVELDLSIHEILEYKHSIGAKTHCHVNLILFQDKVDSVLFTHVRRW